MFFNVKDPGSRLVRWELKLADYLYEVVYIAEVTSHTVTNSEVNEIMGHLFEAPDEFHLAPCVLSDIKSRPGNHFGIP